VSLVTGKTIVLAGPHRRERGVRDANRKLRDLGAVVVDVGVDGGVDDMRSLAVELLARERRIDVLAHLGARRDFEGAILHPYLLTRLLADRVAESRGRVLWSVGANHRDVGFDPDAPPAGGRRARAAEEAGHQLARALLVHEWVRRDERIGVASFEPDVPTLVLLCGSDERLTGGHFVGATRVADAPAALDVVLATRLWDRCAAETRVEP
jgi:hypothetical protein